jgi:hypothetical protein
MKNEPLNQYGLESLGWKFEKKGNYFSFTAEVYSLNIEIGVNTGTIWNLTIDPDRNPNVMYLEWQTYSSYDNEKGQLRFVIENMEDMERLMKQLSILNHQNIWT